MSITEFLNKWSQDDLERDCEFQDDFRAVLDSIPGQHSLTALKVLSDIHNAELIIDTLDVDSGRISFGPKDKSIEVGISVTYSLVYGQQEADWLLLLRHIAGQALKTMK